MADEQGESDIAIAFFQEILASSSPRLRNIALANGLHIPRRSPVEVLTRYNWVLFPSPDKVDHVLLPAKTPGGGTVLQNHLQALEKSASGLPTITFCHKMEFEAAVNQCEPVILCKSLSLFSQAAPPNGSR